MHSDSNRLRGVIPALITPFTEDGAVDQNLFEKQVDYLRDAGVAGFFVSGTTSEGAYVSSDERDLMVRMVQSRTGGDLLCCVAVIAPDTSSVLRGIDAVAPLKPDFISAVTPFYLGVSQADLSYHFRTIADHCPAPLILYNIPQNTHNRIELPTILELAEHPNVAGIKDSSGDFPTFQRGLLSTGDAQFTWIQGEDLLDAASMLMGARCIVTGLGNAWVEPYVRMYDAAQRGDSAEVIRRQQQINSLARIISVSNGAVIPAIKSAAALQGRAHARMRIASMQVDETCQKKIKSVLQELGIL